MTPNYRFSGHETFPCRYAWLPKAVSLIASSPTALANDKGAMVELGIGKNMVRATRFWVQAAGMATSQKGNYSVTELGALVLGEKGYDQHLEDLQTLWLIHWQLSTHVEEPLFAWDFLMNRWPNPEFSKTDVLTAFRNESNRIDHGRELSDITLEQHFDTFLHSYVPTRSRKGDIQEDNLDCPLVELHLIETVGEKKNASGKHEAVYSFRREAKPEVTPGLFLYCIEDHWRKHAPEEKTITFRDVAVSPGSPGQIFKLPEEDVRERLEQLENDSGGAYRYQESATMRQLTRSKEVGLKTLLKTMYRKGRG